MSLTWIAHLISWIVGAYPGILRAILSDFRDPVSFPAILTDLMPVAVLALAILAGFAGMVYLAHGVLWAAHQVWELAVRRARHGPLDLVQGLRRKGAG